MPLFCALHLSKSSSVIADSRLPPAAKRSRTKSTASWHKSMAVYGSKDMGIGNAILFDGSEIRRSPVEVGSLSHYSEGVLIAGFLNHQQYFFTHHQPIIPAG